MTTCCEWPRESLGMAHFGITEKAAFHSHETAVADKVLKSDNSKGGGFCVLPFKEDVKRVPSTETSTHISGTAALRKYYTSSCSHFPEHQLQILILGPE